ncbi:hypothetical protein Acy02nite_18550 [Actinoplanes cyaneus]|uniref:Uncharacterized protein n=1 Tax=Actinoplanes cyaneus TaxID=52696 RepID=A0A919IE80_9ACTN|nr:hypothetical protein [Actinoplanes cyaneus]MCW2136876.1 hypothetical protein [Actinoplanes cyaneus]GID63974.1 hypothetical protein Acy02nite_18550 [Actinoplanes cyaneus]
MTDQIERLFEDLRADTMPRIVPPGSAAARGTVRSRRIRRTAMAGAGLAVVVAAGIGFGAPSHLRQPAPAAAPLPQAELDVLAKSAATQIGLHDGDRYGGTATAPAGRVITLKRVPGTYEIVMACGGEAGNVAVNVSGNKWTLQCGPKPAPVHLTMTLTAADPEITLDATPDATARGRYALAYSMQLSEDDQKQLMYDADAVVGSSDEFGSGGGFLAADLDVRDERIKAGKYTFTFSCAGEGWVKVKIGNSDMTRVIKSYQKDCDGKATGFDVTLPAGTIGTVMVTPSPYAENQAAVAWRWDRR